jgi:hypothetical protein
MKKSGWISVENVNQANTKGYLDGINAEDLAMPRNDDLKIIILFLNPKKNFNKCCG